MKPYVRAQMSCAACHIAAGTQPRGGSFIGLYGRFPQWNKRAHRVIALQDRIAECFLYSMNGKPPAYSSKAMIAIVAYIAWLSRGVPVGAKQPQDDRYIVPLTEGCREPGRRRQDLRKQVLDVPPGQWRRHQYRGISAFVGGALVQ